MNNKLLILPCLLFNLLFCNIALSQCTCALTEDIKMSLKESDAVFSGRVVDILKVDPHNMVVQIENYNVWKAGNAYKKSTKRKRDNKYTYILSSSNSNACGFRFKLGNEYLIYSQPTQRNNLVVTSCNRTKNLHDSGIVSGDILELGRPLDASGKPHGMERKK